MHLVGKVFLFKILCIFAIQAKADFKNSIKGNCFAANTPIHTPAGLTPIQNIQIGDQVLSCNPYTHEQAYKTVTNTFERQASRMVKIFVGSDTITTTYSHPFRVGNQWIVAGRLNKGDQLLIPNQALASLGTHLARSGIAVDSVANYQQATTVYNFEVDDTHTYFVGNQGYLVHNWCAIDKIKRLSKNANFKADFDNFMNLSISNLSVVQRKQFYEVFNSLTDAELSKFFREFNDFPTDVKTLFKAKPSTITAWTKITNAQIKLDATILAKVDNILLDAAIPATIKADIGIIIDKLASRGFKCRTCLTTGTAYKFIDEVLNDLSIVSKDFGNLPGFDKLLTNLKAGSTTTDEAVFVIDVVQNQKSVWNQFGSLTGFEHKFDQTAGFAVDFKVGLPPSDVFIECKNWGSSFLNFDSFVEQFANTMKNITTISKMKYLFNSGRWRPSANTLIETLKSKRSILEAIGEANLQKFITNYDKNLGLSDLQIENFINANYNSILL
jgi:hypothetical protein